MRARSVRLIPFLVLMCGVITWGGAAGAADRKAPSDLSDLSRSLEELAERIAPAVVRISATAQGTEGATGAFPGRERRGGSGVILTVDGYIITNAHVVDQARQIRVQLSPPDAAPGRSILKPVGSRFPARIIGVDRETDLALIKIDGSDLPYLPLGDSDRLRPGQIVLALGSPLGLDNSVTMGVISAVGRQLRPEDRMVYIQTDAPINPGNSGGALVSAGGELVGINTLIFSQSGGSEGIGFAAPSNIVLRVFDELRTHGRVRRGEIGASAQTISPVMARGLSLPRDRGVIIGDVFPGGPADQAGLRAGDVVLTLNGKAMENGRQLDVNLYRAGVGSTARLDVLRGDRTVTLHVPVVERADDPERFADLVDPQANLVARLGILGIEADAKIAGFLPWLRAPGGVVVAAREAAGITGDEGGLEVGDTILAVNGAATVTLSGLKTAAEALRPGDAAVLTVNRRGRMMYLSFEME